MPPADCMCGHYSFWHNLHHPHNCGADGCDCGLYRPVSSNPVHFIPPVRNVPVHGVAERNEPVHGVAERNEPVHGAQERCPHYDTQPAFRALLGRVELVTLQDDTVIRTRLLLCEACVESLRHWFGARLRPSARGG